MIGYVVKTPQGALMPADEDTAAYLAKFGQGEVVRAELKRERNYRFHKKYFSLIGFAYDLWTEHGLQAREYRGMPVMPSRDRFRKDLQILAGYYEPVYGYDGSVRLEPKSIAFANMDEDEFAKLFDATIDVILHKVLPQAGLTEERLRDAVNEVVRYAA